MQRLAALDGYRAIAALIVVTTHVSFSTGFVLSRPLGAVFSRFDIGVAIFFLLSGFLLYRPWARAGLGRGSRPDTWTYAKRRFFRIMPAYWLVVIATLLVLPTITLTPGNVITNLTLTQFYPDGMSLQGLTQMWSVAVEVSFYTALPIIGWFALRRYTGGPRSATRQLRILAALWLVGTAFTALRTLGPLGGDLGTGFWLIGFLDWFAVGMAVGLAFELLQSPKPPLWARRLQQMANETGACLLAAGALFIAATTPLAGPYLLLGDSFGDFVRHLLYPVIALLFLLPGFLASERPGWLQRFMCTPTMQFLGKISYGIFLWHLLVRDLITHYFGIDPFTGGFLWILPLTVAITIPVAWASWVAIEEPLIRFSRRRAPRKRGQGYDFTDSGLGSGPTESHATSDDPAQTPNR